VIPGLDRVVGIRHEKGGECLLEGPSKRIWARPIETEAAAARKKGFRCRKKENRPKIGTRTQGGWEKKNRENRQDKTRVKLRGGKSSGFKKTRRVEGGDSGTTVKRKKLSIKSKIAGSPMLTTGFYKRQRTCRQAAKQLVQMTGSGGSEKWTGLESGGAKQEERGGLNGKQPYPPSESIFPIRGLEAGTEGGGRWKAAGEGREVRKHPRVLVQSGKKEILENGKENGNLSGFKKADEHCGNKGTRVQNEEGEPEDSKKRRKEQGGIVTGRRKKKMMGIKKGLAPRMRGGVRSPGGRKTRKRRVKNS